MSLADATLLAAKKEDDDSDDKTAMKAPAQLHQSYTIVPARLRLVTLVSYLKSTFSRRGRVMQAIISISHRERIASVIFEDAKSISKTVSKAAYITSPASPKVVLHRMHGPLPKPFRTAILQSFSTCKSPSLLITTDVSSRGLDIPSVDLAIEYDPAFSFANHIHHAEALQLHFEQRLLDDTKRLELARKDFKSHIRAYATHIREERVNFHITELHLGHTGKIFELRKAPGDIGGRVARKTRKRPKEAEKEHKKDERPAQDVFKMKSMRLMNSGAEGFNIG
ncbi:hypothetical protein MRS44_018595 [Fusarium solani]|uniref:uncharacterized protein n=1 Tax=Fusarium solani TaxID=169388 RepID=UPI0032C4740A|nr:hypothetical protein MRS44_018595 [Fusarium solani]